MGRRDAHIGEVERSAWTSAVRALLVVLVVLGAAAVARAQSTTTSTSTSTTSTTGACVPLDCNDANPCTTDTCVPGSGCQHLDFPDGASCSDGDVCNGSETCLGGACQPGTPLNCADVNPCTADSCNSLLGVCQHVAVPNGTPCDDTTVCNGLEVCLAGICLPGTPLDCDDSNPCSADPCDPVAGCQNTLLPDGAACDDGVFCNGSDTCLGAACVVHAGDPCAGGPECADSCDEAAASCFEPDGTPCSDDGDACTADTCEEGVCASAPSYDLCLDEFLCYTARTTSGSPKFVPVPGLPLADAIESGPFDVKKPGHVCTPADMNGGGTVDAATHLESYRLRLPFGALPHVSQTGIEVTNQLGTIIVDTKRAALLLVPTAKSLVASPPPPDPLAHDVDHYKCYKVRKSKGTPAFPKGVQVAVGDQFTSPPKVLDVKRARLLCLPVDKNGEGIRNAARSLFCYGVKVALGQALHVPQEGLFIANQFGPARRDTRREGMLCVPSATTP
jgi:hypothetical protein